jgi:cytochrome c biogenesis protein
MAGFTFDQALPNGQSAVVYARGTPHNISFRANNFSAQFDPKTGLPVDYVTDLSVYQDGELVAHSNHLRVNDPLAYGGIVFHQSSLIPSVNITITDTQGCIVCDEPIVLDQSDNISSDVLVNYAKGVPIAGSNLTMGVFFIHSPSVQLAQVQHPSILITVGAPNAPATQDKALVRLQPGQSGQSLDIDNQWTIRLNSASEATVLLVTKDTGSMLIWPAAIILILSLCITFYFPQKRVWMRIEGQRVQMASLREHFTNIRTDMLAVTRSSALPYASPE